jgi:hypothetical protein
MMEVVVSFARSPIVCCPFILLDFAAISAEQTWAIAGDGIND